MSNQQDEGWLDPLAATGQLRLVLEAQEKGWLTLPPVPAFLDAIGYIQEDDGSGLPLTLLDVGCGVGMYAAVCREHCPNIIYDGCDLSPHMIALAREHFGAGKFFVANAATIDEQNYDDIILASCLLDVCPDWQGVLANLIKQEPIYLILNRVRVWNDPCRPTECREYTTCYDTTSWAVTHNWPQLASVIKQYGYRNTYALAYQVEPETTLMCYVLKAKKK